MALSWKQEAKSGVNFFTSMRRLCREVDQGVKDIHSKLDTVHGLQSGDINRHLALKGLLDRKKDIGTVKLSARTSLREMRNKGSEFEQNLQACSDIIDVQLKQLSNIQAHLMQYGFVPHKEPEDATEEAIIDSSTAELEPPATPPQQEATNKEIDKKSKLTPCLEDFGLSSYTLNMLNRPSQAQQAEFKVPGAAVPESVGGKAPGRDATMRLDSVPTPFQNRGLTVTPSLFSSQAQCYGTGLDRTAQEVFCLPCTPDMTVSVQGPAVDRDCCFQSSQRGLAKTLDFSDSPVPPVLHTPGVKQIPRLRDAVVPSADQGGKSSAARQLKLEDAYDANNSPVPPILRTPGIQQISTRSAVEKQQIGKMDSSGADSQMELPRTPEMTYSLKDLEDMTVSFQNTDLSPAITERSAIATSFADIQDSTQTGAFFQQSFQCGNVPPPRQGYIAKPTGITVPEPQLSRWTRDRFNTESVDMPASPELTMSYTTVARSNTAPQTALTVTSQRLDAESRGKRLGIGSHVYGENALQNEKADFPSLYSTTATGKLADANSRVFRSRENINLPFMPELKTGKLDPRMYKSMLPDQPKLQQPVADLPATPKFMGSYHFMGNKK